MPVLTYDIDKDRRDIEVADDILRLVPDANPFLVVLSRARKKAVKSAEYKWFDEEPGSYWTQINNAAGYAAGVTDLVVDDAAIFAAKDVVKCARTGEVMFVTAVSTTTNTVSVLRGYGTTGAAAMLDNDWLVRLGNAMEENSDVPAVKTGQPSKNYNYTQIFRTPFDQSMTSEAEDLKTSETERTRLRRNKSMEHRMDLERALLFGERKEDVTNKRRMTGGLFSFITSNNYDSGGALTEAKFEEYCEMLFTYGSKTKLFLCSPKVGSDINQFAAGKIQTRSGESTYGLRLREYQSFHGTLYLATTRVFEKDYAKMGLGIDMDYVWYRPLRGRDTKLRTNIQAPGLDGWQDEYLTEAGLEVRLEKVHGILSNATA
jgi:hypothetical protein